MTRMRVSLCFITAHDPVCMPEPMFTLSCSIPLERIRESEDDVTEDGPVDYPIDEGEDGDDVDGGSHEDDGDDEDEDEEDKDEEDEEEEEEHLAPDYCPASGFISLPPEAEVERLLAMPTPPPSPLISLSPPSAWERLARCTAPSAHSSPPPVPSPLLPFWVSNPNPETEDSLYLGPCIRGEDLERLVLEIAPMTVGEVNTRVTKLAELHEYDTHDLYALLEDAQDSRTRISHRVTMDSQRVNLLMEDRIAHQETILIVEEEAYASREAWAHVIGLSQAVYYDLQTHREQQAEIAELRETNHRRQIQMVETLRVMRDMRREMGDMHAEFLALREQQRRAGQPGPDARVTDHQEASRDADSRIYSHGDNQRNVQTTRPCFYADFMKCQPLNFKGNEGVVGLTRWIEKMESVFNISGCAIENQVKFATCTLLGAALTWWNYIELTLICTKFVANETEKVDKYVSGLLDNIYWNVKSARPKTLDETIELANDLMDQKLRTYAERQSDNKRKADRFI
ncbi:hypothetical protein Tco_0893905 [Tanacetum coccineum]|uniref:Retrotransposon gag domain-containing protein n=1 Tax=Tanacetum coccineum TaxID=301880 RepID=A0ABQ5CDD1_9ASTR